MHLLATLESNLLFLKKNVQSTVIAYTACSERGPLLESLPRCPRPRHRSAHLGCSMQLGCSTYLASQALAKLQLAPARYPEHLYHGKMKGACVS